MSATADDDRAELAALSSALRGLAEWHRITGSRGLPGLGSSAVEPEGEPVTQNAVADIPTRIGAPRAVTVEAPSTQDAAAQSEPGAAPLGSEPSTRPARTLEVLASEVRSCQRCGLHSERTQTVFARGTGRSGLVFIGEGPGEEEDRTGLPFVGPAGQLLDKMIEAMKLDRDDVYVCNIVKCRPPKNRKPDAAEMSACTPWLQEQLELIQPKVIVALGATAVQGLLGTTSGITRLRGRWKAYRGIIPVMPTFHPAYLLRQPRAKREVWQDLQEVLRHLNASAGPTNPAQDA